MLRVQLVPNAPLLRGLRHPALPGLLREDPPRGEGPGPAQAAAARGQTVAPRGRQRLRRAQARDGAVLYELRGARLQRLPEREPRVALLCRAAGHQQGGATAAGEDAAGSAQGGRDERAGTKGRNGFLRD